MAKRGRPAKKRRGGGPSYEEVMAEITAKENKRAAEREIRDQQRREDQQKLTAAAKDPLNRLDGDVRNGIIALGDPDEMMSALLDILTETEFIPDPGQYYTFIYNAKTPRIEYDEYPLIACLDVFSWGFKGFNFHWAARGGNPYRNYTWQELPTGRVHLVREREMRDARSIPYQYFKYTSG